jgi:hypothetical protein
MEENLIGALQDTQNRLEGVFRVSLIGAVSNFTDCDLRFVIQVRS